MNSMNVKLDIAKYGGKMFFQISLAFLLLIAPLQNGSAASGSHPRVLWK
jgi:hypothetical protein